MHNLITIPLQCETDIVLVRQYARQVSGMLKMEMHDCARLAAAVSEIARNAYQYAGGGRVSFAYTAQPLPQVTVQVTSRNTGFNESAAMQVGGGLMRTKRLMDFLAVRQTKNDLVIEFAKSLTHLSALSEFDLRGISEKLACPTANTPLAEMRQQNVDLLQALDDLKHQQEEMLRLNRELADTNSGMLALYTELEEQAATLRRNTEAKARFYSEMNHEVRTPINSILSLAELLIDGPFVPPLAEQEKPLGFIRKSAKQLSELVDDLLDLARLEAGKMPVRMASFDVAPLFAALHGTFRLLHANPAVQLHFDASADLPTLYSDETKVTQVLRNFISNAMKFTEAGEICVSARATADKVIFSVSDTGIGISAADQAHLFDAFAQIESPQQSRVKGTGLGLSVSRNLTNLLGGELTVISEAGRGSTFSITLPLQKKDAPSALRVLLIDDDDITRYLLAKTLASPLLKVTEAPDGLHGLREANATRPDAIILDLNMPGMPGEKVLEMLKANLRTREIPVLVYTGKSLSPEAMAAIKMHAVAVFSKAGRSCARDIAELLNTFTCDGCAAYVGPLV